MRFWSCGSTATDATGDWALLTRGRPAGHRPARRAQGSRPTAPRRRPALPDGGWCPPDALAGDRTRPTCWCRASSSPQRPSGCAAAGARRGRDMGRSRRCGWSRGGRVRAPRSITARSRTRSAGSGSPSTSTRAVTAVRRPSRGCRISAGRRGGWCCCTSTGEETLPAARCPVWAQDGREIGFVGTAVRHHELGPVALALVKRSAVGRGGGSGSRHAVGGRRPGRGRARAGDRRPGLGAAGLRRATGAGGGCAGCTVASLVSGGPRWTPRPRCSTASRSGRPSSPSRPCPATCVKREDTPADRRLRGCAGRSTRRRGSRARSGPRASSRTRPATAAGRWPGPPPGWESR